MASITFLFAASSLLALSLTHAQDYDCANLKKTIYADYLLYGIQDCAFPYKNLESACVAESCPKLSTSGVCPFDDEGNEIEDNMKNAMAVVIECLKASTSVCGVPTVAFDIQGMNAIWISELSDGNVTFGPRSQLSMPWQNGDFLLASEESTRTFFNLQVSYTLIYQLLFDQGPFTYKPDLNSENQLSTPFSSLPVTFTELVSCETSIIDNPGSALELKVLSTLDKKPTFKAGSLTDKSWPADEAAKANEAFAEYLDTMLLEIQNNKVFPKFITYYTWYALMAMDSACNKA